MSRAYGSIWSDSPPNPGVGDTVLLDTMGTNKNVTADTTAGTLTVAQAGVYQIAYGVTLFCGGGNYSGVFSLRKNGIIIDQTSWRSSISSGEINTGTAAKVFTLSLGSGSALSITNQNPINGILYAYIEVVKLDD
jgi:hypothetical protein